VPPMPAWRPPTHPDATIAPVDPEPAPARRARRTAEPTVARPAAEAASVAAAEPTPPPLERAAPPLEDDPPLRLGNAGAGARARAAPPQRPPPPRKTHFRMLAGFLLGVPFGLALGWWASGIVHEGPSPAAGQTQTAALSSAPAAAPPSAASPTAESAPDTTAGAPAEAAASPAPPADALEPAHGPDAAPIPADPPTASASHSATPAANSTEPALSPPDRLGSDRLGSDRPASDRPATDKPVTAAAGGCAAQATPADRAICGDVKLQRLQENLRQAYAEALAAHQDRALLRERQLAWRDARSEVSDPDRLARLYEERIRKLKAATAEALQQR